MKTRRGWAHRGNCLTFSKRRMSEIEAGTSRSLRKEIQILRKRGRCLPRGRSGVIQTGRDDDLQTRLGAGDWALEPGGADREFGDRQRGGRVAGERCGAAP